MLPLGRLIVTEQPAGPAWLVVPPGHSAESNGPPLLLSTWNVKSRLPHAQRPVVPHVALAQSVPALQSVPRPQAGHEPPQSTSVSLPLRAPSVQVGGWQSPPVQMPLAQSPAAPHAWPLAQRTQFGAGPPQSTAVSAPLCTPSAQFGTRQNPPVQTPLGHSLPVVHVGWQTPPEQPPV
jgi:hypothetical protein